MSYTSVIVLTSGLSVRQISFVMINDILRLVFVLNFISATSVSRNQQQQSDVHKYSIQMIGYSPSQHDDYVAVVKEATPGYIVGFEPLADADRVHHMLLYGCTEPALNKNFWRGSQTCSGDSGTYILYAWARNAPNLSLPKNVAFSVGHDTDGIRYFVLQVHYAQPFIGNVRDYSGVTLHMSIMRPVYQAAVMLFVSGQSIPPHRKQVQNNISCEYTSDTEIHPFAFRTHTHAMGRVVSAYFKRKDQWTKIGSRNPQWPQLFEIISTSPVIRKGDLMAASCRFDSYDKSEAVPMGSMGTNEMCNFYMMFYWDAQKENPFPYGAICIQNDRNEEMKSYPAEGFELLPYHPELEHHAHQSMIPFGAFEEDALTIVENVNFGQVAGLTFDNDGNLIIFHRSGRVWDKNTFDQYNVLLNKTPIDDDVIVFIKFNNNQSHIVRKLGKNKFYVPHGIYMDGDGFLYTTDVGSHTVAKWKLNFNDMELVWEQGKKFTPNTDRSHFCKPAGILRNGNSVFVADGYCNSRIVELGVDDGKIKNEFGGLGTGPAQFQIPHDIVVNSQGNLLVADRENGRVQELTTSGEFIREWTNNSLFSNVYSMDSHGNNIYMVPGRSRTEEDIYVFVGRAGTELVEYSFCPTSRSFGQPHVLRVSPDGNHIFIGDIAQGKATLWKFRVQREDRTTNNHFDNSTFTGVVIIPALVLLAIWASIVIRRRLFAKNGNNVFDRKGFKPLRTDETVGFISDISDSE